MSYAVVFPGQGAQSVGMLAELAEEHAVVKETFAEAADTLGKDFWTLAQNGPQAEQADTRNTQPLMFIGGVAVWRVLEKLGLANPSVIAGHSVGEFSALVASGALSYTDGLNLVNSRAQLMAAAVPDGVGGMAALIGLNDEEVIDVCNSVTGERVVEAVNFNAPGQIVISGHKDAIEKAIELAKERGAKKALMLAVSVPNHSSLMRDAGEKLVDVIDSMEWQLPNIPLIQNAQAVGPAHLSDLLSSIRTHVYSPVQWVHSIERMRNDYQIDTVVESGPGKVLSGLVKRIDRKIAALPCETPLLLQKTVDALGQTA